MKHGQIEIQKIKVKDLYEFACRTIDKTKPYNVLPLTKHRALAHTKNPYADENDIGLLVASVGGQCIGYLGILPGLLKKGNQFSKVYWPSAWFVSSEFRGRSVGSNLMRSALSTKVDFAITGMSKDSEKVCRHLGFREVNPLNYYVINISRINILIPAFKLLRKILRKGGISLQITNLPVRFAEIIFRPIKKFLYTALMRGQKTVMGDISYKEVEKIQESGVNKGTGQEASSTEFYRDTNIINWMLRNKWVLEADKREKTSSNFHFSDAFNVFRYIALNVYSSGNEEERKGFLVLSVASNDFRTTLKVLDYHFPNRADYKYIAFLALKYAKIYAADYLVFPDCLEPYFKKGFLPRLLLCKRMRTYLFHPKDENSPLAASLRNINIKYCDSDIAFT